MSSAEMPSQRSGLPKGREQSAVPFNCLKLLLDLALTNPQDSKKQQALAAELNASVLTETKNPDGDRSVLLFCRSESCGSRFTVTNKYSSASLILSESVPGQECGLANLPI